MIAAWRSDLDRILRVFNVSSTVPARPSLTPHPQTELATNTRTTVSDIHHGVANTHAIVSDARNDAANTRIIVSNIHRNALKNRGDTDGQILAVSWTFTRLLRSNRLPLPRLTPGQQSWPEMDPITDICIQSTRGITASVTEKCEWNRFWYSSR